MNRFPRIVIVLAATAFSLAVLALIWTSQALSRSPRVGFAAQTNGTFFDSGQALGNSTSHKAAFADLDGLAGLDAFVANQGGNSVWLNNGSGVFNTNGQMLGGLDSQDVALGNLDDDTDIDAVVANSNGQNQVWINNGSGQFSAGQIFEPAESQGLALGDLDGSPGLDVFIANNGANTVWLNNSGVLTDSLQSLGSSNSFAVELGDLDNDTDLDAFVANGGMSGQPDKVWINQGGAQAGTPGVFLDSGQDLGFSWTYDVALGDLDGDTDLDAFTASWFPNPNTVWINNGSGNFTDSGQALGSSASLGVSLADVDGDNDLDALIGNNTPDGGQVWINQGGDQGGTEGIFLDSGQVLGMNTTTYHLALEDLDGDTDKDAFAANFGVNKVWINSDFGVPQAVIDVDRETNPDGDDVYYWASGGNAILPIMLTHLYTATVDVHARIESGMGTLTETIPFSVGTQVRFLNIVNPMPDPNETITLTISTTEAGVPPTPADVTDNLLMAFVDANQGLEQCVLCYADWLSRFVGFDPTFWTLHHLNLPEQEASNQWLYYTRLFSYYSSEMSGILAGHPSVLWSALNTLEEWTPAVESLASGTSLTYTVSTEMVDDAIGLVEGLKSNASPGLAAALQQEQDALDMPTLAGLTMDQVWSEMQIRRPIEELFVTVVLKN